MDLNDLALFARVVEQGSFTAAAHAMALPKSSVTRGIARLEKELGVRLIQRTTRQRGVTDAGRELYERVRGAVGALEEAAEAVREQGKEPRGIVRVTANPDAAMMGMPELLVELRAKLPSIHVELVLTSRVVDLVAEGIDLGIRAGALVDSSLIAKKVGSANAGAVRREALRQEARQADEARRARRARLRAVPRPPRPRDVAVRAAAGRARSRSRASRASTTTGSCRARSRPGSASARCRCSWRRARPRARAARIT